MEIFPYKFEKLWFVSVLKLHVPLLGRRGISKNEYPDFNMLFSLDY
jgi:hypothetical protein